MVAINQSEGQTLIEHAAGHRAQTRLLAKEEPMKLGFVGTGEITAAMVTGLKTSDAELHSIRLSPRNPVIAAELAHRFPGVSVGSSNQEVLDSSETVVIAVRPQIVRSVLSELRFRPDHHVISVVSALSLRSASELVSPATRIARAVPLPSTAKRLSPTPIYPPDRLVCNLFAKLGTVFAVETESEFDAMCAATSTIAYYFAFTDRVASWLARNRVPESKARDYVARLFWGLTTAAVEAPERSFESLSSDHATAGGINEQFLKHMLELGVLENVAGGLDAVMRRIVAASQKF
jgi:pyrroline-5-carboxylate reductase